MLIFKEVRKTLLTETKDDDLKLLKNILLMIPTPLTQQEFKDNVVCNTTKKFKIKNFNHNIKVTPLIKRLGLTTKNVDLFNKHVGTLVDFCHLLNNMLLFNKQQRYTISQCLDHDFFINDKTYITKVRLDNPVIHKNTVILYANCQEREWMGKTALCLFNNRHHIEWYNHRCLFQAVDIFSRYLYVIKNVENCDDIVTHNEFDTNLLFMTCIYICIKYFSSIHYPIPFRDIVQEEFLTPECIQKVEAFEGGLIKNCFAFDVYHDTLYEVADMLSDDHDIQNLLVMFTQNTHLCHLTPLCIYLHYKQIKDKIIDNLLLPI